MSGLTTCTPTGVPCPDEQAAAKRDLTRRWVVSGLVAVVVIAALLSAISAFSFTRRPITIDGQFADWDAVLLDRDNIVYDATGGSDLDVQAAGDRNIARVAYTYDDTNVYFLVRAADTLRNSNYFIAYIDVNQNNRLDYPADRVMVHYLNPSDSWTTRSYVYQYGSAGSNDSITGDGIQAITGFSTALDADPGSKDYVIGSTTTANNSSYGSVGVTGNRWVGAVPVYMESRITWNMLGVPPGTPLNFHFSMANNINNIPGNGVQDNTGPGTSAWTSLDVYPDRQTAGSPGTTVTLQHTVSQSANITDTIDLSASTVGGWPVVVKDAQNNTITSVTLRGVETTSVSLVVTIPSTATVGTAQEAYLTAKSRFRPTVTDTVKDEIYPGALVVYPDRESTCATSTWIDYTHYITNTTTQTLTVDLSAYSYTGWTTSIAAGTSGSGSATSAVIVGPSQSATVTVRVNVPASATLGQRDITELRAVAREDGALADVAQDVTTVGNRVDIAPDNSVTVGKGQLVTFTHTITNNWSGADTVTLSSASTASTWTVSLYKTLDGGVVSSPSFNLAARESTTVVVVMEVPFNAGSQTATLTLTATSTVNPAVRDTATDVVRVAAVATYADPMMFTPQNVFRLGSPVFVKESGELTGYTVKIGTTNVPTVRFKFVSPSGLTTYTTGAIIEGNAEASLPTSEGTEVGAWTVYAYKDAALETAPYLIGSAAFTITYDAGITVLGASDAQTMDQTITVNSLLSNRNNVGIANSAASYLVWYDKDGSGAFNTGDYWVNSSGAVSSWNGVVPANTQTSTVSVPATRSVGDSWTLSNRNFPVAGIWNVTETWRAASGFLIDAKNATFYSPGGSMPNYTVTKTLAGSAPYIVGSNLSFDLVVRNSGGTTLTTVPVRDQFSSGSLEFVSASRSVNSSSTGLLTWNNVGPLSAGQSTTVTVVFKALAAGATQNSMVSTGVVDALGVPLLEKSAVSGFTLVSGTPIAVDDAYSTSEDITLTVSAPGVLGNDTGASPELFTAGVSAAPGHGTLNLQSTGAFTYKPDSNWFGADSFEYTLTKGTDTDTATVTITVSALNDPPVASDDSTSTPEDTALDITIAGLLANDTDVDLDT
ncbi:MAG: hypothetical protein CVT67_02640, partial [Actinobacteria bacterium HGW-Actinobacteria-7]